MQTGRRVGTAFFKVKIERFVSKDRPAAKNPMTKNYLDTKLFRGFTIEHGDIVWNDYELGFPIWDLYEGKV